MNSPARRLGSTAYEKPWGSPLTEPWCRNPDGLDIGEVWFDETPSVPLLVKFLFTLENLSVQVHPNDEYAREHANGSCGKTEMWHILRAEPGARVAIGLREAVSEARLRESCGSEKIVDLLNWIPVQPGDTFFIEAGTIHAIGAGLALCEVQQPSDVTYRLYDWDYGRELHIENAIAVARRVPSTGHIRTGAMVECDYFRTYRVDVSGSIPCTPGALHVVLQGEGVIGGQPFIAGEAWVVHQPSTIESDAAAFLISSAPPR